MYQAIIFDMDGVLIHSEPLWRRAEVKVFSEHGLVLKEDECRQTTGLRTDEVVAFRARNFQFKAPQALIAEQIESEVAELIDLDGTAVPGASSLLKDLQLHKVRIALCSSSSLKLIETVLKKLALKSYFEIVHSAEHEKFGKPHPAVYLNTCSKLKVDPLKCLAIEDSLNGVKAAKAAGLKCIAVPEEESRVKVKEIADYTINSLEELNYASILSLV